MNKVLMLLLICTLLSGCATLRLSECQSNAFTKADYYKSQGYDVRFGHGWYRDEKHIWCEYYKPGKWLMAEDSIWPVFGNYPISRYKDYKLDWYGYPEKN